MAEVFRHIIATGWQTRPYNDEDISKVETWLTNLVDKIDMNVLIPAKVVHCDTLGNEGITGTICIDTSHSALHFWKEPKPFLRFDLFSCKYFDEHVVLDYLAELDVYRVDWTLIDRTSDYDPEIFTATHILKGKDNGKENNPQSQDKQGPAEEYCACINGSQCIGCCD